MTSQLQQLAAAIRGLADEAAQPMQVLIHAQRRARQLAAQANALGEDGHGVSARLFELQSSLDAVTESMSAVRDDAQRFADFLAHGGAGVRGSVQSIAEANIAGWPPADPALGYSIPPNTEPGRYRDPGEAIRRKLADAVGMSGPGHPDEWIEDLNPHFYSSASETWHNNCGSNARSFADVFHGRNTLPALGDTGGSGDPGEFNEMWDALEIPSPKAFSNPPVTPGTTPEEMEANSSAFTAHAYSRIGIELGKLPPGSVAIIGVDWDAGPNMLLAGRDPRAAGGHWFNAFVDGSGRIWWADGQLGRLQPWPPPYPMKIWNAQLATRAPGSTSIWKGVDL